MSESIHIPTSMVPGDFGIESWHKHVDYRFIPEWRGRLQHGVFSWPWLPLAHVPEDDPLEAGQWLTIEDKAYHVIEVRDCWVRVNAIVHALAGTEVIRPHQHQLKAKE